LKDVVTKELYFKSSAKDIGKQDVFLKLLVYTPAVKHLIGADGRNIEKIKQEAKVFINLTKECFPNTSDQVFQIKGSSDAVLHAHKLVRDLLKKNRKVRIQFDSCCQIKQSSTI
jgi:ribosomal protein S3